jgi:hypothetical protein
LQQLYFYIDDSGVFHRNEASGYFVYAGFVFLDRTSLDSAKRKYRRANKDLKRHLNVDDDVELKASMLEDRHKRSLYNSLRDYESFSVGVRIPQVRDYVLDCKRSICRFKDYALKRGIKSKLEKLIRQGVVSSTCDTRLIIQVDEQLTATNGYYQFRDSIKEEFNHGVFNQNYLITHPPIFTGKLAVDVKYCESKHNYLIQASDILANKIWHLYLNGRVVDDCIPQHQFLTLP